MVKVAYLRCWRNDWQQGVSWEVDASIGKRWRTTGSEYLTRFVLDIFLQAGFYIRIAAGGAGVLQ